MKRLLISLCVLFSAASIFAVDAQQLQFNQSSDGENVVFNYQWIDQSNQTKTLEFSLDKSAAQDQYQNQTVFKPEIAQRYVYIELMKQAQRVDPKEARVLIQQRGNRLEIEVTSRYQEMLDKWKSLMSEKQDSAFDDYLFANHYTRFVNHLGQEGVIPDHIRYIQESREILLPAAQAIYEQLEQGSDTRTYVNLMLGWIQTIPYNELTSRIDSNGAGFFTPIEVLNNNKGDCDSKATLTASLMRSLLPDLSMAMVYLPNHALLAVNLGERPDEKAIDIRGALHVLIEPTGPAMVSIGKISDDTARHIANGTFRVVPIP
ncbi:hypothetical protein Q4567_11740 [Aliiglaciecola sp. 2_MG-2023]|uniref:hypothetical protein n=1 Tax=unclassified Aliiglaciecola TaxID=2593648 RepID=UPI0026E3694C|nr:MULTISPECIES: hypothetical protein [unclassified Aliiglaciecola]MDO6711396.1 hypothetical protein [Aliiglaciecola sp. 2_MG-2023]MDO6752155.1 hypothetical protein [Aliiglaciecola sp. 1_MG-2023]